MFDVEELRQVLKFYEIVDQLTDMYLQYQPVLEHRKTIAFRRSFVIQDGIRLGRILIENYGTQAEREQYPRPESIQRTVEQARAEKKKRDGKDVVAT